MGGVEIHNVQITLAQIPHVQKAVEGQYNNPQNQAQTLAVLNDIKRYKELSQVRGLNKSNASEPEEEEKSHLKQNTHINIKI